MNELPEGWNLSTLGILGKLIRGVTYKRDQAEAQAGSGLVPILRANNIGENLTFDGLVFVPEKNITSDQYLQVGDIVIAASSGSSSKVGKAAQMKAPWHGSFGAFCYCLRPSNSVNYAYVGYYLQTSTYRNKMSSVAAGVNINNLKRSHIENVEIAIPPINEQIQIVEDLDKQFSRLDESENLLNNSARKIEQLRLSLLEYTIRGGVQRLEPSSPPTKVTENHLLQSENWALPIGWKMVPVSEVTILVEYGSSSKTQNNVDGIPVLRMGNIQDGKIVLDKLKYLPQSHSEFPKLLLQSGDILFNRTNSRELVGKSAVFKYEGNYSFASYLIRLRTTPECLPEFLAACLNSPSGRGWVDRLAVQQTGQANVNGTKLKNLIIPLPPILDQEELVSDLSLFQQFFDLVGDATDLNLKRIQTLRQSLLASAFSGHMTSGMQFPSVSNDDTTNSSQSGNSRRIMREKYDEVDVKIVDAESLAEAIRESSRALRPSELYRLLDESEDSVDRFYEYLREAKEKGLISVPEAGEEEVLISVK